MWVCLKEMGHWGGEAMPCPLLAVPLSLPPVHHEVSSSVPPCPPAMMFCFTIAPEAVGPADRGLKPLTP
jgi:hypothetical protein